MYTRFGRTLIFYFFFTQPDHVGVRAERASAMPRAFTFLRSSDNLLSLRWWLGAIFLFPSYTNDMKFIVGNKIGMTQIFNANGITEAATVLKVPKISVVQVKNQEKDGYDAVQVGFETVSAKKIKKPQKGQFKESGNFKTVKEFRVKQEEAGENAFKIGDKLDVSVFSEGDVIKVSGLSKGKGFSGAVKRHGFHGMPASHGHHSVQRHVGSIGQRFPQHTLKGMRMAGRMGGQTTTVRGLKVAVVDKDNSFLAVKGAVPGNKGGLVMIQSQ